jgi:peptidyl-dipeptidase Dcp
MKAHILATAACLALAAASEGPAMAKSDQDSAALEMAATYFANESPLPFHAPDFTKITPDVMEVAFEKGMAIHAGEIARIRDNPEPPTFQNTIVALETSGQMLGRVSAVFFAPTRSRPRSDPS